MLNEKVTESKFDGYGLKIERKGSPSELADGEAAFERFFQADVDDRKQEFRNLLDYCMAKQSK